MKYASLTDCEQLVMKTVWEAEDELSLMEVMQRVNDKYHKTWKPQTVSTFLARLVKKGYLRHIRQGRIFYYRIMIPMDDYKGQLTTDYVSFWNHDNADEFLCALAQERPLRQDEIERIQKMIDGLGK